METRQKLSKKKIPPDISSNKQQLNRNIYRVRIFIFNLHPKFGAILPNMLCIYKRRKIFLVLYRILYFPKINHYFNLIFTTKSSSPVKIIVQNVQMFDNYICIKKIK